MQDDHCGRDDAAVRQDNSRKRQCTEVGPSTKDAENPDQNLLGRKKQRGHGKERKHRQRIVADKRTEDLASQCNSQAMRSQHAQGIMLSADAVADVPSGSLQLLDRALNDLLEDIEDQKGREDECNSDDAQPGKEVGALNCLHVSSHTGLSMLDACDCI